MSLTATMVLAVAVPIGSLTHFIYVPLVRQATNYTCGIAATQSVLGYYGEDRREDVLATAMKADPVNGTETKNIISYVTSRGYQTEARTEMTPAMLEEAIDQLHPVIVLIQAWPDAPAPAMDWANDWMDGHFVVVTGYDADNFYFMDPSTLGQYTYIPRAQFLNRWHDTDGTDRLVHFGLIITKGAPTFRFMDVVPLN